MQTKSNLFHAKILFKNNVIIKCLEHRVTHACLFVIVTSLGIRRLQRCCVADRWRIYFKHYNMYIIHYIGMYWCVIYIFITTSESRSSESDQYWAHGSQFLCEFEFFFGSFALAPWSGTRAPIKRFSREKKTHFWNFNHWIVAFMVKRLYCFEWVFKMSPLDTRMGAHAWSGEHWFRHAKCT